MGNYSCHDWSLFWFEPQVYGYDKHYIIYVRRNGNVILNCDGGVYEFGGKTGMTFDNCQWYNTTNNEKSVHFLNVANPCSSAVLSFTNALEKLQCRNSRRGAYKFTVYFDLYLADELLHWKEIPHTRLTQKEAIFHCEANASTPRACGKWFIHDRKFEELEDKRGCMEVEGTLHCPINQYMDLLPVKCVVSNNFASLQYTFARESLEMAGIIGGPAMSNSSLNATNSTDTNATENGNFGSNMGFPEPRLNPPSTAHHNEIKVGISRLERSPVQLTYTFKRKCCRKRCPRRSPTASKAGERSPSIWRSYIYLFGDIKQLPPVLDRQLYGDGFKSEMADHGQLIYRNAFTKAFVFTTSQRQRGDDPEQQNFRDALDRLSVGESTIEDYEKMISRNYGLLPDEERESFKTAIRLFTEREPACQYNIKALTDLRMPVAKIKAKHNNQTAARGNDQQAMGLEPALYLSRGSRVMLKRNLWTDKGLVNGSLGFVREIIYAPGTSPDDAMPLAVLVEFDKYKGPTFASNCVPICPITSEWTENGQKCCYKESSTLFCRDTTILSANGVQQGDPLGPLLFCLGSSKLTRSLRADLNVWYLDDGTEGGDPEIVFEDLITVQNEASKLGLELNFAKCELYVYGGSEEERLRIFDRFNAVAPGIQLVTPETLELLGAPLTDWSIERVLDCEISQVKKLTESLGVLPAHQSLFLLRNSMSLPRLMYILRATPCHKYPEKLREFDDVIKSKAEEITSVKMDDVTYRQASLPVKSGGLGLPKAEEIIAPAQLSSLYATDELVSSIVPEDCPDDRIEVEFRWKELTGKSASAKEDRSNQRLWSDMLTIRKLEALKEDADVIASARLLAASTKNASAWLFALPVASLGTLLDDDVVRIRFRFIV
ncbi:uncharacterized protein LOC129601093 [Paramacrobiotus metropolitanus]|uniref:uncharacterized protein LOC129601093 n=1 Tax=Paramacrobiotus metropolitanus TaxID=2943436 RepID=UPI0024456D2D|nr:uncharacterized protein LOC129601093 [Paramacrobiotus metropolitanus]